MDQRSKQNAGQSPVPGPDRKLNGEKVVQQLEKLLERYEELDESTLAALERAFDKYKELRPKFYDNLGNFLTSAKNALGDKVAFGRNKENDEPKPQAVAHGKKRLLKKTDNNKNNAPAASPGLSVEDVTQILEDHEEKMRTDCMKAESALAKAKAQYAYQKRVLAVYGETVEPFLEPFKRVMENLVYFAACADPAVYEAGKTPLSNKIRGLRSGMQPGMWGEHLDTAHLSRIGEMFEVAAPAAAFSFRAETNADVKTRIDAYEARIKGANELKRPYDIENAKLANRIKHAQFLWEYVDLLRCFLPQLEKITGTPEEEESARWAAEIGNALLEEVRTHVCRNPKMKFLWVYPHGEISRKDEKIQVQFIVAEMDCPGLYYKFEEAYDGLKPLGCIAPGCTRV